MQRLTIVPSPICGGTGWVGSGWAGIRKPYPKQLSRSSEHQTKQAIVHYYLNAKCEGNQALVVGRLGGI